MQIDVFTLVAQIVNFLILVLLLRRFLYRPIIKTMDKREKKIASDLEEARKKEEEAQEEARRCAAERQSLEDRRGELLSQAQEEADTWKRDLIAKARREVEESKARWNQAIEREKETFLKNLQKRASEEIYAIARKVLADLADVEVEKSIIKAFLRRMRQLDETESKEIAEAARAARRGIMVYSSFEIDNDTRRRIDEVIREKIAKEVALGFRVAPDLICGIELRAGGRKAAWSLAHYFETLGEDLSTAFTGRAVEE